MIKIKQQHLTFLLLVGKKTNGRQTKRIKKCQKRLSNTTFIEGSREDREDSRVNL